jgi:hypothetical protein
MPQAKAANARILKPWRSYKYLGVGKVMLDSSVGVEESRNQTSLSQQLDQGTEYPPKNAEKDAALYWIFHGVAAIEMMQQTYAPLLALIQLGNQRDKSLENETELAEMFVPMTANIQQNAEKNCAARLFQRTETWRGFQVVTP